MGWWLVCWCSPLLATIAPLAVATGWWSLAVAGATLTALTTAAARSGGTALRALVFLDVVFAVFTAGRATSWPPALTTVLVCVLPLAALLGCDRVTRLRPAAPWLRTGHRPTRGIALLAMATVVLAGVALTVWTVVAEPAAPAYLGDLQALPWWVSSLGVLAFALVNPIWEEAMFTGVILEELAAEWGVPAALVGQAVLFGAAHWAGFPSGWVGMAMAAGWGLVLGIIRVRTNGIALGYAVHVGANAVIGFLAVALLR